jgi:DNA repair protein RadC
MGNNPSHPTIDHKTWHIIQGKRLYDVWPEVETHVQSSIANDSVEMLQLITLDKKDRLLDSRIISIGTVDHLYARLRYVAEQALHRSDIFGIILAHNHTSGDVTPSWDDISYTKSLHHAFAKLDICLLDHLIAAHHALFSLRRHCLIF